MPHQVDKSATVQTIATGADPGCSVFALLFDRQGNGREVGWQEIHKWQPEAGLLWLVGHPSGQETQRWLRSSASQLEASVVQTLLRSENRPRCLSFREGTLITLRAVNQTLGHNSDEKLATVSIWIDLNRVIVLRSASVRIFNELRTEIRKAQTPTNSGDLLVDILHHLVSRMEPLLTHIDDSVDNLEDLILLDPNTDMQQELAAVRHQIIELRRHLLPQQEALNLLQIERTPWMNDHHRRRCHEISSRFRHYLTDLDSCRERGSVLQDEINNNQAQKMNQTMKIVAVFTAFLMPVNAVTSLLGTNIEGIPGQAGTATPWGFTFEVTGLILIMVISYFIFKKLKWFD
ncbi:MAG: hypothetical protein HQL60_01690 [Magnetococcales bacterium]|nr:hypothetical protein [Magnetococcales bacterium]